MKSYFVDTNILIDIKRVILREIDASKSRYHFNYNDLIELLGNEEIGILVVPTVLEEIKKGSHKDGAVTERFINKLCIQCELNDDELDMCEKLYNDYISGEDIAIPIFKEINGSVKCNTNDARILAEVTVLYNCNKYEAIKFLTNNICDFINTSEVNKINSKYGLKSVPFNSMKASNIKKEIR